MTDEEFAEIVRISKNRTEVCRRLNVPYNGASMRKVSERISRLGLNIAHFLSVAEFNRRNEKYPVVKLNCPVCGSQFVSRPGSKKRDKKTCSRKCSNIQRPRGGALKISHYRTICFKYHKKECVICGEGKILSVHHYDENHENNAPENLIPLCPTHHQYVHSGFSEDVLPKIKLYREKFLSECMP